MTDEQIAQFNRLYPHLNIRQVGREVLDEFWNRPYVQQQPTKGHMFDCLQDFILSQGLTDVQE